MRNICRKTPSSDATVAQTVSFWGGQQRLRCWGSWPWRLGHDLSLRHDLVTPLLRLIYQGVLRHPQTFNVRAWLERKAARVFRGRSCTKRPCTPGSGHFSQCWAQQHKAIVQAHRTRVHFKFKLFFSCMNFIHLNSLTAPPSGHVTHCCMSLTHRNLF